jgi:hypothetical protein
MSENLWFVLIFVAAFVSGFFLCKYLDRRTLEDLKDEMEELRVRLQGAENLLSEKAIRTWQRVTHSNDTPDSHKGSVNNGEGHVAPDHTKVFAGEQVDRRNGSAGSETMAETRRGQKIRLTKVIGTDNRIRHQESILGFEETPPVVGESYRIMKEGGGSFYTSVVTRVSPGYIQTLNSVYKIESVKSDGRSSKEKEPAPE